MIFFKIVLVHRPAYVTVLRLAMHNDAKIVLSILFVIDQYMLVMRNITINLFLMNHLEIGGMMLCNELIVHSGIISYIVNDYLRLVQTLW
jgi:hypothetical protein